MSPMTPMSDKNDFERSVAEHVKRLAVLPDSLTDAQFFEAAVNLADKTGVVSRRKKMVWEVLKRSGRVQKKGRQDWLKLINSLNY